MPSPGRFRYLRMEISLLPTRKLRATRGFSLMETMVAIVILSIGMLSLAALMSKMTGSTETSRYMSIAALLASEKLEDLNRLSASDPEIAIPSGSQAGDLATNKCCVSVTTSNGTESVDYFDQVYMSAGGNSGGSGGMSETITGKNGSGQTTYGTYTHLPDGTMSAPGDPSTWSTTAPAVTPDTIIFNRRWVIEKDTPVVGTRRITVLVSLQTPVGPAVNFRMSSVRQ